jgi:hypothetical protein
VRNVVDIVAFAYWHEEYGYDYDTTTKRKSGRASDTARSLVHCETWVLDVYDANWPLSRQRLLRHVVAFHATPTLHRFSPGTRAVNSACTLLGGRRSPDSLAKSSCWLQPCAE